jgi:hypothetical protein
MSTDRHNRSAKAFGVKLVAAPCSCAAVAACFASLAMPLAASLADDPAAHGLPAVAAPIQAEAKTPDPPQSQPQAVQLLRQVLHRIVHGPAFDAKVRETVWTTGREVVGVGTYEQAGGGSGQFNLQVTMHDGDGKHRLQQISDGRLTWTRSEIAGQVALRRVDVGRLDQWVGRVHTAMTVSPGLRVGGWAEMLTTIERDHVLRVDAAQLKDESVWVISGTLRDDRRQEVLTKSGRQQWPALYPSRVRVALKSEPDPQTGFGALLPIRMEFWSDRMAAGDPATGGQAAEQGRLITLIELYSIRPIAPPPPQRFRFENQDAEVNFTNETDKYIELYGVQLTERQRRQLKR